MLDSLDVSLFFSVIQKRNAEKQNAIRWLCCLTDATYREGSVNVTWLSLQIFVPR